MLQVSVTPLEGSSCRGKITAVATIALAPPNETKLLQVFNLELLLGKFPTCRAKEANRVQAGNPKLSG